MIGNAFEGVTTHQTQPHEQVNGAGAAAARSCDSPWEVRIYCEYTASMLRMYCEFLLAQPHFSTVFY